MLSVLAKERRSSERPTSAVDHALPEREQNASETPADAERPRPEEIPATCKKTSNSAGGFDHALRQPCAPQSPPESHDSLDDPYTGATKATSYKESSTQPEFRPWTSTAACQYAIPCKNDPWEECFKLVLKFDDEMCRGWREEIDTLLVFAGLFSAAVTAFTIESYQWLQQDPQMVQIQLLQSITNQLNDISRNVLSPPPASPTAFSPSTSSVRVNIFWFISLTLSLSAVLIGILCKQWLREYQRYEGLSAKDAFPVRQLRYEGLLAWQVPKILSSLPLILQTALVLFFAGLLDLLWSINALVGSTVTVVVGIVMICLIGTTILPSFQSISHMSTLWSLSDREPSPQCAFKSPQSWAFHLFVTWTISVYSIIKQQLFYGTVENYLQLQLSSWNSEDANWVKYDQRWQAHGRYMQKGINWCDKTFARGNHNVDAIYSIFHCLETLDTHISAACVSNIIEDNWNPLVPLVGLIQPTLRSFQDPALPYDVTPDFANDMVLASYLVVHHRANASLSLQCMERCTRMLNGLQESPDLSAVVLEMLSIVIPTPVSSQELGIQLTSALAGTLHSDAISQSDLTSFWAIIPQILQKYNTADIPLDSLFHGMEAWVDRQISSPVVSVLVKQFILRHCALGVSTLYSTIKLQQPFSEMTSSRSKRSFSVRDSLALDVDPPAEYLQSFISLLDRFFEALGGPTLILSLWEADNWNSLKKELIDSTK